MRVSKEIINTGNIQKGCGITITWTKWDGKRKYTSLNFPDFNEALRAVLDLARADGWYSPKWWEIWRWKDTMEPEVIE